MQNPPARSSTAHPGPGLHRCLCYPERAAWQCLCLPARQAHVQPLQPAHQGRKVAHAYDLDIRSCPGAGNTVVQLCRLRKVGNSSKPSDDKRMVWQRLGWG